MLLAACCLSAALAGALGGMLSATLGAQWNASALVRGAVVAALLGLLILAEFHIGRLAIPQLRARVPRAVWKLPALAIAATWGAVLGFGALTFIKFGCFWALHLLLVFDGDVGLGVLAGGLYGLARTLPIVIVPWVAGRTDDFLLRLGVLDRYEPWVHRLNAALLAILVLATTAHVL